MDNAEDCPVCLTAFDNTIRRPRTLPCGHTFCTTCINGLVEQNQVTCPTCRSSHTVPDAGEFPVSYITEAFIRKLRGTVSASVTGPSQEERTGLSKPIRSMLEEQEAKVLAAICTCQKAQAQLDQYQTALADCNEHRENLEGQLKDLIEGGRKLVQSEQSKVVDKKEQLRQGEQQLDTVLQVLRTIDTRQEAFVAIDDADHYADEEKQRAEDCLGKFPDVHTVTIIRKVKEELSAALKAIETVRKEVDDPAGNPDLVAGPDSSITARLEAQLTPTSAIIKSPSSFHPAPHPLRVEELRKLTQPAKSLVNAGLVFAIHQDQGRSRYAKISLADNCVHVHSLKDQQLPSNAVALQMEKVVPAQLPCQVFLDLSWPHSSTRRVRIRLQPDTPLGRQFLLLCTGQEGPCYANTKLWKVWDKGRPGEWVCGGDYENNNGTGGAALLPDLGKGQYRESGSRGVVWGWWHDPVRGAMFCITTRECLDNSKVPRVFGHVVSGFDALQDAVERSPISQVKVTDSGVIPW